VSRFFDWYSGWTNPLRYQRQPPPPPVPQPLDAPDQAPAPATPKADAFFSRSSLLHFGQAGRRDPTTSASKW